MSTNYGSFFWQEQENGVAEPHQDASVVIRGVIGTEVTGIRGAYEVPVTAYCVPFRFLDNIMR